MTSIFKDDRKGTFLNALGADKPLKSLYRIAFSTERATTVCNACAIPGDHI